MATEDRRAAVSALSCSRDRGEADRFRAVVVTLAGWTGARITEAFVRVNPIPARLSASLTRGQALPQVSDYTTYDLHKPIACT